MTKLMFNTSNVPFIDRDEFITPFDRLFDQIIDKHYPEVTDQIGVKPYQGSAYPKVNVYEYDDKVGIVAEIPGLDKSNVSVDVEEQVLTISGDKHGFDSDGGKCITRELKQSSFKRSFNLGEHLDGDDVSAKFKDGMLSISIPKKEPEQPKKKFIKIS